MNEQSNKKDLEKVPKENKKDSRNTVYLISLLLIVSIILNILFASIWLTPKEIESDDRTNGIGPRIRILPGSYDIDSMPQIVVNRSFKIENVGDTSLNITGVSTSCGCTTALVVIGEEVSPRFGSNNNPEEWIGKIGVGESAKLIVTYDAGRHPDFGHVRRVVYIKSDDPLLPEIDVTITAYVLE